AAARRGREEAVRWSYREDDATAGQAAFGFGQLARVDRRDRAEPRVRLRKCRGAEQRVADEERIRGERLLGIDFDDVPEQRFIDPLRIHENDVGPDARRRRLQVQAALDVDGLHDVAVGLEELAELARPLGVRARGDADEDRLAELQDVAAVERPRLLDGYDVAVRAQRRGDALRLRATRRRAGTGDDRELVEDDGRVLDEDGVGQIVGRRQPLDRAA